MKKLALLATVALAAAAVTTAQAQGIYGNSNHKSNRSGGYTYDSQNGNSYNSNGNGYSSGYNSNTGSQWNSNTNGSRTTGTDSKGNSWSYDRNTGNYYNYGTGESCHRGQRQ